MEWQTQRLGDEASGPGMASGAIKPIGSAQEQGPWDKLKENPLAGEKDITRTGPFVGITRRPKATKLPVQNEALPGYDVEKKPYLG
jgi:hypothetical protein